MSEERGPASFNVLKAAAGENPWKEERPDWGHGSRKPVQTFTEEEIREVMKEHTPTSTLEDDGHEIVTCGCSVYIEFTGDHLIAKLKEHRGIS